MPTPESARTFFLPPLSRSSLRKEISRAASSRALLELDARVHVFSVFAKDDDVDLLGMLHRAGHALVVLHRAHAGVEVENLAQGHVERANAAADRRGERSLDGDAQIARRGYRVVGQPGVELADRLFRRRRFQTIEWRACRRRLFRPPRQRPAATAFQMSRPVPSPSMKGMMGLSGT